MRRFQVKSAGVLLVGALLLNGCGIPRSMDVRTGTDPRYIDDDVRFRTTYYFRVFDSCRAKDGADDFIQTDSLYRFRMTGKSSSLFNNVFFESGTLKKHQVDPFGADVAFDQNNRRFYTRSQGQTQRAAACAEQAAEIARLDALIEKYQGATGLESLFTVVTERQKALLADASCGMAAAAAPKGAAGESLPASVARAGSHLVKAAAKAKLPKLEDSKLKAALDKAGKSLQAVAAPGSDHVALFSAAGTALTGIQGDTLAHKVVGAETWNAIGKALDDAGKKLKTITADPLGRDKTLRSVADGGGDAAGKAFVVQEELRKRAADQRETIKQRDEAKKAYEDAAKTSAASPAATPQQPGATPGAASVIQPVAGPNPAVPVETASLDAQGAAKAPAAGGTSTQGQGTGQQEKATKAEAKKPNLVALKKAWDDLEAKIKKFPATAAELDTGVNDIGAMAKSLRAAGLALATAREAGAAAGACPGGGAPRRSFQVLGPEGWKTFDPDDRLIMAMSVDSEPLIGTLNEVSARVLSEKPRPGDVLLKLVRARQQAMDAIRTLEDQYGEDGTTAEPALKPAAGDDATGQDGEGKDQAEGTAQATEKTVTMKEVVTGQKTVTESETKEVTTKPAPPVEEKKAETGEPAPPAEAESEAAKDKEEETNVLSDEDARKIDIETIASIVEAAQKGVKP